MEKITKLILISFLILPNYSFAEECKDPVQVIRSGEKANCDGFLFSDEAEKQAAKARDDAKYYKDLSELLHKRSELTNEEIRILDERLNLYMNTSNELAKEVNRKERQDFWQKTIYFSLGVLATGLAVYGASQLKD